jgi:hypothetical protein
LHLIVKRYASKRKRLPGVKTHRAGFDVSIKGMPSVSMYQEDRRKLLEKFVRPWLSALYQLDAVL